MVRKMMGVGSGSRIRHQKTRPSSDKGNRQSKRISRFLWRELINRTLSSWIPVYKSTTGKYTTASISTNNKQTYNQPFRMEELLNSKCSHDTAVGPDKIHYQFLKHLPHSTLSRLLDHFNFVWSSGKIPSAWKEALIIPLPTSGKDRTNPHNYRPAAFAKSCKGW